MARTVPMALAFNAEINSDGELVLTYSTGPRVSISAMWLEPMGKMVLMDKMAKTG